MRECQVMLMCCLLTVILIQVTSADAEDKSDEVSRNQHRDIENLNVSSLEVDGPPDSHEAMNNREILNVNDKTREKRSYEFLMGLVNNNSKYEVTKIDPSTAVARVQDHQVTQDLQKQAVNSSGGIIEKEASIKRGENTVGGVEASELLLELMVKIAAHPDHWDRVHQLLQKIDNDLMMSKQLVDDLERAKIKIEPKSIETKQPVLSASTTTNQTEINDWPEFHGDDDMVATTDSNHWQHQQQLTSQHKSIYPKTFAYQRVTGRPLYLNKNPKAYIAVSVIAPKPSSLKDDLKLEKELRQLKPWTHTQNLSNMANLRKRWGVDNRNNKN